MAMPYKTVLISGAGSGFGRAMAQRYAQSGWQVAVTDINLERAEETVALLQGGAEKHFAAQLDVQQIDQWQSLVEQIVTRWGGLGVLINNAGIAAGGKLEETPLADWQWVLDIDLMGVVKGCHAAVPQLRRQQGGHIVNISSFAALAGAPQIAAYGCAKAGVVAVSELLRAELYNTGVNVSVVCPAFVKTNLMDSFRSPVPGHKNMVENWMAKASVSAQDVADQVYQAVERQQFLVLTHRETRWLWRLKRWFPELYFKMLMRSTRGRR